MNEQEIIEGLKAEGFTDVQAIDMTQPTDSEPHTHDVRTVHVILRGELVVHELGEEAAYRAGDRVEFPAGTTHSIRTGEDGMRMVVGFRKGETE